MPFFLRSVTRRFWFADKDWLGEGEFQADSFHDLKTEDNTLSVWLIEDISNLHQIQQVAVALVATREFASNFDYTLIELDHLKSIGIKIEHTLGETPYNRINQGHFNLEEISASKLFQLAQAFQTFHSKAEIQTRIKEKEMRNLLLEAYCLGFLDTQSPYMRPKLLSELQNTNCP